MPSITYEEFVQQLKEFFGEALTVNKNNRWKFNRKIGETFTHYPDEVEVENEQFKIEWCSGGVDGGSCWSNSRNYSYTRNPEKGEDQFLELDRYLATFENLNFLKYRDIMNKVHSDYRVKDEYYGNNREYQIRTLEFRDLYNSLKEFGLI